MCECLQTGGDAFDNTVLMICGHRPACPEFKINPREFAENVQDAAKRMSDKILLDEMPKEKKKLIPRVVPVRKLRSHYRWTFFICFYGLFCLFFGQPLGALCVLASGFLYRHTWRAEKGKLTRENRFMEFGDDPDDIEELHFPFCGKCRIEHQTGRHF
jgi:hypothetical protein